ncbi:MAG: type I-C CRISPR-associated endonuclease Cas1 [Planctomycetes bacterium]|nr:type I-C CRISPR-associated endonuclease Cas1 [Planctomycetota bacterium]
MKHLLNTLYVTTQGAYLAREGDAVLVRVEKETRLRVPIHTIESVVCFGRVSCSPSLMGLCGERNVAISFLSERGRFLARVEGRTSGNVLLRRQQYRLADEPQFSAAVATSFVAAKIANSRTVLQRAIRDHPENPNAPAIQGAVDKLALMLEDLKRGPNLETVRGIEGDAARTYFATFDHLITAQKDAFFFRERSRRPPLDNVNALLSFLYTILTHDAAGALETVGLDPQVGFLHRDRPGRPSLALDLVEEFRAFLADRLALSLINLRQVDGGGFKATESGAVHMADPTRKALLVAYQKRKQEEIQHPFLGEKTHIGVLVHLQARLLARYIRGDLDGYPPFIWK